MAAIRNVVLAGVSGNLGPAILRAVSSSSFNVTVFTRPGSSPPATPGVETVEVDYESIDDLTAKLQGKDAVVSTIPPTAAAAQTNLIQAAVRAGVARFLPSEFGSDLDNAINRAAPVYKPKVDAQELLKTLAAEGKLSYTVVYTGAFLDWGLRAGFPINPVKKVAALHDGGVRTYTTTTLATIGKAVVGVLAHPEETKNRVVRVGEASTTLKELLALSQEIVGADGWTITEPDTTEAVEKAAEKLKQGIFSSETILPFIYRAIWGEGAGGHFDKTDNELLGIQQLDKAGLKQVIQSVVDGQ
ncbi:CipA-like oxidoreductase [Aspergillus ustus]|uniref:CipA-like oxidoreductase n=1 Tax=Aspergillus ustus TaxID=40382 RepID=A0A0C1E6P9_ASPUT|nr:CipA-like oxidoreductase [Aspergillus ustus]